MKPINATETGYERFEILGHNALFTNMRIDRKSLPEGIYGYDLRDSDDCSGEPFSRNGTVHVKNSGYNF
ncbi:MAG: hypothetical protein NC203_07825 [Firmicutes bacterium]|nr:hypothetical protein [Bacillota bacterium]